MSKSICSVDGCGGTGKIVRGLCGKHYAKWRKYGDPLAGREFALEEGPDKILSKMVVSETGCWVWTGNMHVDGYGLVYTKKRRFREYAHRYAYSTFVGPIPDGLQIDHLCHTRDETCTGGIECPHRRCVNPDHLELVTQLENFKRGRNPLSLNARKTHCKNGHEFTPENTATRSDGYRRCMECDRIVHRRATARTKRVA